MQNLKEEPSKRRPSPKDLMAAFHFLMRYRSHPEALEPYLVALKVSGVPEANVSNVRNVLIAWRRAYLDKSSLYRIDNYLTVGMGAVDLVLLQVVLPIGVRDRARFIAVLSLAVSLVMVASSLFVSFVKRDQGITGYGNIHGTLIFLALFSGTAALAAMFWHVSSVIALVTCYPVWVQRL